MAQTIPIAIYTYVHIICYPHLVTLLSIYYLPTIFLSIHYLSTLYYPSSCSSIIHLCLCDLFIHHPSASMHPSQGA